MAPQKGGQATKQQKQQQSVGAGSGNANPRKPATASATVARPAVVPAIPLPMMQRQASIKGGSNTTMPKQSAPVVLVPSNGYPVASLEAALLEQQAAGTDSAMPSRPPQRRSKQSQVNTNGTRVEKPGSTTNTTTTTNGEHTSKNRKRHHDRQHLAANGTDPRVVVPATHSLNGLANGVGSITFGDNVDHPTAPSSSTSVRASTAPSVIGDVDSAAGPTMVTEPHHGAIPEATSAPILQPQPTIRPTELTPPNHAYPNANSHDAFMHSAVDSAGFYAPHHSQPNRGSIMFGGVPTPDSHTPSPASGAFMPPPPPPPRHLLNGINGDIHKPIPVNGRYIHNGHTDSNGTNFAAPVTPFPPGPEHITSMDSYGPIPASVSLHRPPPDAYPPNAAHYEPPTPHSFHGSHASGDFNGLDNITNFHPNGHGLDRNHGNGRPHGAPPMQPFLTPQQFPRRSGMEEELLDSVIFFQNQFNSAELADCTLELKYPDGYSHPVKINAHKLILARSPALKQYIMIARAADPGSHLITVNAHDRYLRSDAWFTAVQRLYLHPLFSPPPTANGAEFAGSNIDQFRFCLGYAAAGHLLEMADVLLRGLQVAAGMINWYTVEEALGFAFEGATQRHFIGDDGHDYFDVDFAYGRETRLLMGSITSFLINYFPPNFELDTTAVDPPFFTRIPATASNQLYSAQPAPAIARGTSVRKLSKGNRMSAIKFGDLPTAYPEEDTGAPPRELAKCSSQLSRILLNLPFEDLRYVLTSDSGSPQAWNTAQDRYHALADVVAEREARRLRAVEAVRACAVPGSKEIQQRLSATRRYDIVDTWDVLNWQEEIIQPSGAGGTSIIRKWIPQFGIPAETASEKPAAYEPNLRESMV